MPPRAAKKGSAKKANAPGAAAGNRNWEDGLVKALFEEDSWQACVSLVVGRSPVEEGLIQTISPAVPQRKLFTCITWDDTLAKVCELGKSKAKKTEEPPMFYEVTECAKVLLDAGQEIPCNMVAKLVKFLLLQVKADDQQRREAEQEEALSTTRPADNKEKGGEKGSDKKGKSAPSPAVGTSKKTKLKRRDHVEPPTYIDDEPEDGPQHYILLTGFYQVQLVGMLDAIGVHVANVIQLCSEQIQTFEEPLEQDNTNEGTEQSLEGSSGLDTEKKVADKTELAVQARKLDLFWSGLRTVLNSGPPDSKLHDLAQLSYTVSDVLMAGQTQTPEAAQTLGRCIFDGLANLIYDCLNWRRQHRHYLNHLKLTKVPTGMEAEPVEVVPTPTPRSKKKSVRDEGPSDQEAKPPPVPREVDVCYYNSLLDLLPPEACSVSLILHCMLEQVVISTDQSSPTQSDKNEEPQPVSSSWLDHELVGYMLQSFLPLIHTEEERRQLINDLLTSVEKEEDKKGLIEKFQAEKSPQKSDQPLIIRHHDERSLRLRNINVAQGFDPAEVELSMVRFSPAWELSQSLAQQRSSRTSWMPLKQQLQHFCTDGNVTWSVVEHLLHQSVFEAMPLSRLDEEDMLPNGGGPQGQTPSVIPWDDPLSYAKQQLHKPESRGPAFLTEDLTDRKQVSGGVRTELDLSDMQGCRGRSLFDWHYAEHHDANILPQVLQLASEEYLCLDTFMGSHNNTLYVFCHNPMSPHHQSKQSWDVVLHTDVKFRKYLEHVTGIISDWTREEELKRDMNMQTKSCSDEPLKAPGLDEKAVCAGEEETLEPIIRKDSLKAWRLEQERLKEEEMAKKAKKESAQKGKQTKEEDRSASAKKSKPESAGKKSRPATARSAVKSPPESTITTKAPEEEKKELRLNEEPADVKVFKGYSMDGKLIHVSGRLQHLFPSDGGHVTVENVSYVEGSNLMKVAVKKDGHQFYTHINQVVSPVKTVKTQHQSGDKQNTDPNNDHKAFEPVEMKTVKQGSLSVVLDSGICLSYSFYGPMGEHPETSQEPRVDIPGSSTLDHIPLSSSTPLSKEPDQQVLSNTTEAPVSQGSEGQTAVPPNPFRSLNLSVPNGLLLQFLLEDSQGVSSEEKGILVRQSYPLHGRGEVSHLQDKSLSKELSRIITGQGAVIRCMKDGLTEVLFADGSVSFSHDSGPVWVSDSEVQEENAEEKDQSSEEETKAQRGCWQTTTPSGDRICTVGTTHKHMPTTTTLLTFKATDPVTHQVMLSREDLVVSVQNPDGSVVVEHADGTRITSLFQEKPSNASPRHLLHIGEQPESSTFKSDSPCPSSYNGYVTRCMDSNDEVVRLQHDTGEDIRNIAGRTSDTGCPKLSDLGLVGNERERADSSVERNDDEEGLSVDEDHRRSVCASDEGSLSAKERLVLVEKEGCATVVMYPERQTAHVFLADGSVITGNNQGEYQVFPSNVGLLHIQSDGKCVYSSDSPVTPSPSGSSPINQAGIYTMSHADKVACDITDPDGNHYQVMEDGQVSVLNFSPAPSILTQNEDDLEEEDDIEIARIHGKYRLHSPRLFLVYEDGSGTELLSSHAVEELLHRAYSDPTIALLKEPLPDTQDEFGITILKPSHLSVWSQWLLDKQHPDITPPNLRNRTWHDFPRVEKKSPGPQFGIGIGRGLSLRVKSGRPAAQHPPVRCCPEVLEMRELYQHRPFTTPLKNTIDSRLKAYIESLMEREVHSGEMKVKEPRSAEESTYARHLLNLITSLGEDDHSSYTCNKRISVDMASLYSQGIAVSTEPSDVSEDTVASDSLEGFKCFTNEKDSKWTERLAEHRQEICEEKIQKEALRMKDVVPFFHPENIDLHQSLSHHRVPDMRSLSMYLPPITKSRSAESFLKDAPQESTPRPLNPTPSQSASHTVRRGKTPEKRPINLTSPSTGGESIVKGSAGKCKSVLVDVTGKPRKTKVRLPAYFLCSKPNSVPNKQFLTVEEPVRRRCRTISLTDPTAIVRGFQFLPSRVDFGTVQEGTSSGVTVVMKNVGVDTCRFHVKQPPPASGLRVIYSPGPVAAGLQVELRVQLFAMCAAKVEETEPKKNVSLDVIINTETEILYLPVTANILRRAQEML